jgi:hypothetical protein
MGDKYLSKAAGKTNNLKTAFPKSSKKNGKKMVANR